MQSFLIVINLNLSELNNFWWQFVISAVNFNLSTFDAFLHFDLISMANKLGNSVIKSDNASIWVILLLYELDTDKYIICGNNTDNLFTLMMIGVYFRAEIQVFDENVCKWSTMFLCVLYWALMIFDGDK